jgi:hypothetical protein
MSMLIRGTRNATECAGTTAQRSDLRGGEVGGEQKQPLQQARQPALLHQGQAAGEARQHFVILPALGVAPPAVKDQELEIHRDGD